MIFTSFLKCLIHSPATPHASILALQSGHLRRRILDLLDLGLKRIWMRTTGEDEFNIATCLGYDYNCFKNICICAKLADTRGKLNVESLGTDLGLLAETDWSRVKTAAREKWIRIYGDANVPRGQHHNKGCAPQAPQPSQEESAARPYGGNAYAYFDAYWEVLSLRGMQITRLTKRQLLSINAGARLLSVAPVEELGVGSEELVAEVEGTLLPPRQTGRACATACATGCREYKPHRRGSILAVE
jgi:hypothetical protein